MVDYIADSAKKNLFWVGCFPSKSRSIGDHAQTYAIQKFLESTFSDYKIHRFFRDEIEKFFKSDLKIGDLILIHSAGDFGDLYNTFHKIRKRIIKRYPNNLIVQLPVSVHYDSAASFEEDKIFFSNRKNVLLLTRTLQDAQLLKANFNCTVEYCPDFVYSINAEGVTAKNISTKRKGILFVLRADYESIIYGPFSKIVQKFACLKNFTKFGYAAYLKLHRMCVYLSYKKKKWWLENKGYFVKDVQTSDCDITNQNREEIIYSTLDYYSKYKLVVTDRFHAGVFCILTNTPVKMLPSTIKGKKIIEVQNAETYFSGLRALIEKQHNSLNNKMVEKKMDNKIVDVTNIIELIKNRRSIRKWTEHKIPTDQLEQILTAALYAPSACSSQAVLFKVLTNKKDLTFLCNNTSFWFRNNLPNVAICVFYDTRKARNCGLRQKWHSRFIWQDTACAMMNMMLSAESFNIKSCWASVDPKQQERICNFFKINKELVLCSMLFLGYGDQKVDIEKALHQRNPIKRKTISETMLE